MSYESDSSVKALDPSSEQANDEGSILSLLLESLQDPNPRVRILALGDVSDYVKEAAVTRVLELAERDPDPEVRVAALSVLGDYVYAGEISDYELPPDPLLADEEVLTEVDFERVCALLFAVYRDPARSLDEQRTAVESLSHLTSTAVEEMIAELYARSERDAKVSALVSMGWNGNPRWERIVRHELSNPDLDIQVEAIHAAGELGLDSLAKDLWRLTYAEEREVALAAIWALGQTGWDGAFERLDELTLHPDAQIRECADEAMEEWLFYNGIAQHDSHGGPDRFLDDE
ncbi:MAG: HEAT repeat domain-containing protein [Anaerolineae bacterium]|nr:HEAT repeat domain-containing protein [Anaerolineae bacterium]